QFDLGFFSGLFQALQGQHVFGQINAAFFLELVDDVVDDALVKVFATQEGVTVGGEHFKLLLTVDIGDFDDGHVKRTATQVVHSDLAITLVSLVQTESQSCGGRLVDDALDFQTGNAACVLGCLTLAVVKVSRHGNHGLGYFFAQVVFGSLDRKSTRLNSSHV